MNKQILIILALLTLPLIPYGTVYGENRTEYTIQVDSSGSATWVIRQTGKNLSASLDALVEFQNKVTSIVEAARNQTQRDMAAPKNSLSITSNVSGSYVTVEYRFYWENFSRIENTAIVIGDIFQVENFFLQLYGDGEVYITYPSQYIVETVSPPPSQRDDPLQILGWPGTEDLNKEGSRIVLIRKSASLGLLELLGQNIILLVSFVVLVTGASLSVYVFRQRRKKKEKTMKINEFPSILGMESDEDRIIKLLRASGGSMYQSSIAKQCDFSRSKTSQLMTVLEDKGIVERRKKGRGKIVVLIEPQRSDG